MERFVKELEYCTYCPKMCRHVCPVSNALGNESLIPQAKMELFNMLRRRAVPWELDYVLPMYGCTGCGLCTKFCVHEVDVASALMAGRAEGELLGLRHPSLERLSEDFRSRNALLQEKLHSEFSSHLFAEEAQVGFMPGAEAIDHDIDSVRAAFTVFDSLNLNFIRLVEGPLVWSGAHFWTAGQVDAARFMAQDIIKTLKRFKTLITSCPTCAWLLREKLPAEGFHHETEVLHITEYLYVHTERLDIRRTRPAAFYQDPCHLGRHLGAYDPPRKLLSRCVDSMHEFFYSREEAECCGGGGLIPTTFPAAAEGQAQRRLAEAEHFDVPLVVTACATCRQTFEQANTGVEVMDLISLLAWSLHDPDRAALPG